MLPAIKRIHLDRSDPFRAFGGLFDECCNTVAQTQPFRVNNLDVYEDPANLTVEAELPGFNQDQIDVTLEEGILQIAAEREESSENEENNYYLRERRSGKWSRSIRLPVAVQDDKVTATYNDGVLKIVLEKQETQQVRKIKVNK